MVADGSILSAVAATPESFFKGKTVYIIVYTSPGGGNDTYARLLARHMPRYIPGKPTFVVQNMMGAGGRIAVNYLYNKAPRDGTVFGIVPWPIDRLQLVKEPGVRFDLTKMSALGSASLESSILFIRRDRYKTLQEVMQGQKPAMMGSSGKATNAYIFPRIVEEATGRKMGESTPHLENPPPGAFYAAHGFLSYVAGQSREQAIIPRRPPRQEILNLPNLADLVAGRVKGRTDDKQTTWFLNLGVMGVQFEAVCAIAYHEATKRGIGREIPTEWFTQSIRD